MVPPEDQDECDESLVYIQEKSNHQSDRSPRPLESRQISIKTINTTHQISNFSLSTHSNNENSVNRTTKLIVTEEEQTKRSRLENIKRDSSSSSKSSSLGKWFFDRKTQKKKYISLSGAILQGTEATVQAKLDNIGELRHIQQQTRHELEEFMKASLLSMKDFLRPSITSNDDCDASHTTASMIRYDKSKLDTWGIPIRTVQRYESRGLSHLFQWQIDCLCVDDGAALRGKNLVFSAPTSGGKTLVAEILMLRRLGMVKGTILFIVPYVALVEEKAEYFRTIWQDIGVSVRVCHGGDGGTGDLTSEVDVAVCTIERANIM